MSLRERKMIPFNFIPPLPQEAHFWARLRAECDWVDNGSTFLLFDGCYLPKLTFFSCRLVATEVKSPDCSFIHSVLGEGKEGMGREMLLDTVRGAAALGTWIWRSHRHLTLVFSGLFIWLCRVLVVAHRIFTASRNISRCSARILQLWPLGALL